MSNIPDWLYLKTLNKTGFTKYNFSETDDDDQLRILHEVDSELQQIEEASI